MAIWRWERAFLTSFAEAALGLGDGERPVAERTVQRLDAFLDAAPARMRVTFHAALLLMPPGPLAKWRFVRQPLAWRRAFLDRLFSQFVGRAPGFLIDRQGILATVKAMVGGSYCEQPEFWEKIDYSPILTRFPERRPGEVVVPPAGPELIPKAPSTIGAFLHERAKRATELPERFPERTVVIIGGGAAGLAAAHALTERAAARDLRIVILEAGALHTNESFPRRTLEGFQDLYVGNGSTPNDSQRIGFIQGRCVGGGTTVNNAGCIQPTREWWTLMQRRWGAEGADVDWDDLAQAFVDLRDPLHVREVEPYILTKGTRRAFSGFDRLKDHYVRAGLLTANLKDCVATGLCNTGCPHDAHTAPFITLLPQALARHERLWLVPDAEVRRLVLERGAKGRMVRRIEIATNDGIRHLEADQVILAAGAVASSALLLRSGYSSADNRHRLVGQRFSCNFASPVLGRFRERLDSGRGIQIGYIVEIPRHRLIIETAFAPPTVLGMLMPQWGERFDRYAGAFNHYGVSFPTLSSDAYGRIDYPMLPPSTVPQIRFTPEASDWRRLVHGLKLCAQAMCYAGAEEIFDSRFSGETIRVTGDERRDFAAIDAYYEDAGPETFLRLQSAHLQGGNVMHEDPTRGVVDRNLKVHGMQNLWIFDSSVFPAPITLNIQYATMAMARYAALRMPL